VNISIESLGTEPVTTAAAKTWLRLDTSDHDTEVDELVTAAREWFEGFVNVLVEQRAVTVEFDSWESGATVHLPYGPAVSITSVKVWDESADDWSSAVAATNYRLVRNFPPVIEQVNDGWDIEVTRKSLQIVYEAGEAASKQALYLIKEHVVRAYDAAGAPFSLDDLEDRAMRLSVNPLGVVI
jgi:uncharacterized phiE125 gp8 family phage protein